MIQKFEFKETEIKGLIEVTPFNADDIRGCFTKDYSKEVFEANGIKHDLAEVFYTTSYKGVIRALHFQREKQQPKLVRCIHGHVYDVVVDLRKDSPTFKKWLAFELIGEKHNEILVPAGCAHGYLVLEGIRSGESFPRWPNSTPKSMLDRPRKRTGIPNPAVTAYCDKVFPSKVW